MSARDSVSPANGLSQRLKRWILSVVAALLLTLLCLGGFVLFKVQQVGRESDKLSDMLDLVRGVNLYAQDHEGYYPPLMTSAFAVEPFLEPQPERVAGAPRKFLSINARAGDFRGDERLKVLSSHRLKMPESTLLFYDPTPYSEGNLIGFADGHATRRAPKPEGFLSNPLSLSR